MLLVVLVLVNLARMHAVTCVYVCVYLYEVLDYLGMLRFRLTRCFQCIDSSFRQTLLSILCYGHGINLHCVIRFCTTNLALSGVNLVILIIILSQYLVTGMSNSILH